MSSSPSITKALFAAGLQCTKKLHLDYHGKGPAEMSERRQSLAEVGVKLVELARSAFPQSQQADPDDLEKACEQTAKWARELSHVAIFDAAFVAEDIEVRTDIVIPDGEGKVDVYEVKSGTKVKNRHVRDLALQVWAIERAGLEVRQAWILHLNTQYRHRGGNNYPVHELFRHVDVTAKARAEAAKIDQRLAQFQEILGNDEPPEIGVGTWCHLPFSCEHFASCRAEAAGPCLQDLPELTRDQEKLFHNEGIADLDALDAEHERLTPMQRRALRAIRTGELVIEPFVGGELRDIDHPLHFIHVTSALQVLPQFEGYRPWQHVPLHWHDTVVDENGKIEQRSFVADGKSDPRSEFVKTLAEAVRGEGTVMVYGAAPEQRIRDLLEDLKDEKPEIRAILNQPRFDLRQLFRVGIYHPTFTGSFDLENVQSAIVDKPAKRKLAIRTADEAQAACQRLLNSRTRAQTRKKLTRELEEYGEHQCQMALAIFDSLLQATEDAEVH